MYNFFGKRVLDIAISLWTLIIVSPLLAVISIILLVHTRKSPFFFQTRVGYRGKLFRVFKFKTLTDARDSEGLLLPDDLRSFPLGTFLRRYSLDELPQLVNIIKGDMSIVGPRPWIPEQLDVFPGRCRMARCSVRPGLTGMAQVYGRNGIPFYRRLCYDIVYARNVSLFMDARIVFQTVVRLLAHKDVRQCEDAFRNISGSMLIRNDLSVPVPFPSKQEEF
jgi:lipopolysaccharide/colanic/teichoic acid biosynthesis glycosyltransferase